MGTYCLQVRLLILGPYETARDTHGAVMVEDHKSPAAVLLDTVYQILVLRALYVVQLLIVAAPSYRCPDPSLITRLTRGLDQRL